MQLEMQALNWTTYSCFSQQYTGTGMSSSYCFSMMQKNFISVNAWWLAEPIPSRLHAALFPNRCEQKTSIHKADLPVTGCLTVAALQSSVEADNTKSAQELLKSHLRQSRPRIRKGP